MAKRHFNFELMKVVMHGKQYDSGNIGKHNTEMR